MNKTSIRATRAPRARATSSPLATDPSIRAYRPGHRRAHHLLWERVGLPASHGPRLIEAIQHGFSVHLVESIAKAVNVPQASLLKLTGIKPRTFVRRRERGRLNSEESEKLARYVRVVDAATELMGGDREDAINWLNEPAVGLAGEKPVDLIHTETGAIEIMQLIGRIRHGVFV